MLPLVNIFWFRRDLRLYDNAGLYHALKSNNPVVPLFIFDRYILDDLEDKKDRRVEFIYNALEEMQEQLIAKGSSIEVYYGFPKDRFTTLLKRYKIEKVFAKQ
jgi:deoxyribodipyrimidine photo-lyase